MLDQVFVVYIGVNSSYAYDGVDWKVERIFSSRNSAELYIKERQKLFDKSTVIQFSIKSEEVYA